MMPAPPPAARTSHQPPGGGAAGQRSSGRLPSRRAVTGTTAGCASPSAMIGGMDYAVRLTDAEARPTAVVAARTTWQEFPALWPALLGEVWDCLHAGGINRGCRNIMLYRDI